MQEMHQITWALSGLFAGSMASGNETHTIFTLGGRRVHTCDAGNVDTGFHDDPVRARACVACARARALYLSVCRIRRARMSTMNSNPLQKCPPKKVRKKRPIIPETLEDAHLDGLARERVSRAMLVFREKRVVQCHP